MAPLGTLIAIEGIDGAGKRTQAALLGNALQARNIPCVQFSFPQYESFFGRLVAQFLNGDFGDLDAVAPHFSALLYAGDRFEAKPALEAALAAGKTIVTDRYVASNMAHQTARVRPELREKFLAWLRQLEYGVYGLPTEDLVILLRRTPAEAQEMVGKKSIRSYTERKHDLQESNLTHLEQAALVYEQLAASANWATVQCTRSEGGSLLSPEAIHQQVMAAVDSRMLPRWAAADKRII
jgi:dTMP kinase